MTKGPAQFHGERLRQARSARSLTVAALAEVVGVSKGNVSHWESGTTTPRPDKLSKLAEVLRVSETYFLRPPLDRGDAYPRFRSLQRTTARARASAEDRFAWFAEIVAWLGRQVALPTVDVPDLSGGRPFTELTTADIEQAAIDTRRHWGLGLGPVPSITRLLESRGILTTRFAFSFADIDALSWTVGGRPLIGINTDSVSNARLRFDAAHELGHMVLHRAVSRSQYNGEENKLIERQAHQFASAFIFPQPSFFSEVLSFEPNVLTSVKRRWGMSIQALLMRGKGLGLIDSDRLGAAYRHLGRLGWRRQEPLDDETPIESPRFVAQALKVLLERKYSIDAILYELAITQSDIETLACLPIGALSTGWGETVQFQPASRNDPAAAGHSDGGKGGVIVPFRRPT